jgi:phage tail protein X
MDEQGISYSRQQCESILNFSVDKGCAAHQNSYPFGAEVAFPDVTKSEHKDDHSVELFLHSAIYLYNMILIQEQGSLYDFTLNKYPIEVITCRTSKNLKKKTILSVTFSTSFITLGRDCTITQ